MNHTGSAPSGLIRWLKFNAVGLGGIFVQLGALTLLRSGLGVPYLVATALAVETAVVHNYFWHQAWTWKDRPAHTLTAELMRFFRFNAANGLLSLVGNVLLMRLFAGQLGMHYLPANLLSIAICSAASFALSHLLVFRAAKV